MKKYFTSESVTEGHPDKMCDLIADTILDECLKQDKNSRTAIETMALKNEIVVAGQITTKAKLDIEKITRDTIKKIGYDDANLDFDYKNCNIKIAIDEQSKDIAKGVDFGGAGDQGIMFGYATDETLNYMPYSINAAHNLAKKLAYVRKSGIIPYLRPDGKCQITVEYEGEKIQRIDAILISVQHLKGIEKGDLEKDIIEKVLQNIEFKDMIDVHTKIYINPSGNFEIGGPLADTGLTGRKIIVDTYGGYARHGGGAFSGKDATKVDRSAAYMLRHIAKNIVANGYAKKCEIQIAYAIGVEKPISLNIDTFGTANKSDEFLINLIEEKFDLTPKGIIKYLELQNPIYVHTTNYGHFGKENFTWEKIVKI